MVSARRDAEPARNRGRTWQPLEARVEAIRDRIRAPAEPLRWIAQARDSARSHAAALVRSRRVSGATCRTVAAISSVISSKRVPASYGRVARAVIGARARRGGETVMAERGADTPGARDLPTISASNRRKGIDRLHRADANIERCPASPSSSAPATSGMIRSRSRQRRPRQHDRNGVRPVSLFEGAIRLLPK